MGACVGIATIAHETYVDLVESRLFGLLVDDVHILIVMSWWLTALVMPGSRRVVVVHGLLPRLARGILWEEVFPIDG
jgi:hypothetical protein